MAQNAAKVFMKREYNSKPHKRYILLFDVDGTLVEPPPNSASAGLLAMNSAAKELINIDLLDGLSPSLVQSQQIEKRFLKKLIPKLRKITQFAGKTDKRIARELLMIREANPSDERVQQFLDVYIESLKECNRAHPYVALGIFDDTITALKEDGAIVGLGTGNLRKGAELKLKGAGLDHLFDFNLGGYGEDGEERSEILTAGSLRCRPQEDLPLIIIGDTPNDVNAAHEIGGLAIGVPHGPNSVATLTRAGADAVIDRINPNLVDVINNLL